MDMGFIGPPFTWRKFFSDGHTIWERLDRSFANSDWLLCFRGSTTHHLNSSTSNHSPLLILPDGLESTIPSKLFRFKEIWLVEKGCIDIVQFEWSKHKGSNPASGIVSKIEKCGKALQQWS